MLRFGQPEVDRIEHVEDVQRSVAATRGPRWIAAGTSDRRSGNRDLKPVPQLVAKVPRRHGVKAARLNHWSTVSGPFVSPDTLATPSCFVSTLLFAWVDGERPPRALGVDSGDHPVGAIMFFPSGAPRRSSR